jgi:hypothetical protein
MHHPRPEKGNLPGRRGLEGQHESDTEHDSDWQNTSRMTASAGQHSTIRRVPSESELRADLM